MLRILTFLTLSILATTTSFAKTTQYQINSRNANVKVDWTLSASSKIYHARLSQVNGIVTMDPEQDMQNKIVVNIPINTLDAHNILLTHELKSRRFFDELLFPVATFRSSRIVSTGAGHYRVLGTLQIKDVQRPVILEADVMPANPLPDVPKTLILNAKTTISRSSFGMDSYLFLVSDSIGVDIRLEANMIQ
ncbi:YceI family protein [Rouxiella sp. Mn2063]|uniref:YceI family protein n=1 Tax=Rouxiella sp. Mn2063 TaxID=3395262 RepID=UPI003BE226E9